MSGRRFLERKDISRLIRQSSDFTLRWQGMHIFLVGTSLVVSIVGLILFLGYFKDDSNPARDLPIILMLLVTMGLSVAFHFCFKRITYMEFLSLIFASSVRVGAEFIMILNRRGIVVYYDDNFEQLFAREADVHDFQEFLALDGISSEDSQLLTQALMNRETAEVPFSYRDNAGQVIHTEVSITPLIRPNNYSLLKAVRV